MVKLSAPGPSVEMHTPGLPVRRPWVAAMKAAAAHFTTSLAVQVGRHGIRVNGVAPATTASETVAPWVEAGPGRDATLAVQALWLTTAKSPSKAAAMWR
mgnify:CR=1 FL=1